MDYLRLVADKHITEYQLRLMGDFLKSKYTMSDGGCTWGAWECTRSYTSTEDVFLMIENDVDGSQFSITYLIIANGVVFKLGYTTFACNSTTYNDEFNYHKEVDTKSLLTEICNEPADIDNLIHKYTTDKPFENLFGKEPVKFQELFNIG